MKKTLLTLVFIFLIFSGFAKKDNRPNIIWIVCEDMSQDLACYGNPLVKTPFLDKLADEGMRFNNMFTAAGVCSPSRTALAVGMHQNAIGAMHMRYSEELKQPLSGEVKTIAHILLENGYQTLGKGKDDYMFSLDKPAFQYKNMDELEKGKPFFAKIHSHYTHRIFEKDTVNPIDRSKVTLPPYYPDVQPIREDWAAYLENIQLLDNEIKNILGEFEEKGLLENTIIFFLSDHGRPKLKGKYWMYDSGIQVPFIMNVSKGMNLPKGFKPRSVNNQLLSAIDISATTLALAGIKKPDYMQGKVFLGDQNEKEREYIFASLDRIGGVYFKTRAVRSKKYKYIKNFNNGLSILECSTEYRKARLPHYNTISILDNYNKLNKVQQTLVTPLPLEELYDLEKDPYETTNLAYNEEYQDVRKKYESVLMNWIEEIDDKGFYPDSAEIQKHFIDYRTTNKEMYRKERLKSYMEIENQLRKDGDI
ncbi:sulfatase [Draconibacterium sp.]|nr:sulfatase [Draconibacterium sp.]